MLKVALRKIEKQPPPSHNTKPTTLTGPAYYPLRAVPRFSRRQPSLTKKSPQKRVIFSVLLSSLHESDRERESESMAVSLPLHQIFLQLPILQFTTITHNRFADAQYYTRPFSC